MNGIGSLYIGRVTHRRFAPRQHFLRYRMLQILIDIDAAVTIGAKLRLFSRNRFNLFSFHDADHGAGQNEGLRPFIEAMLNRAGLGCAGGEIRLLCMPRILGHVFNPLSVYFCRSPLGGMAALIFEVNNTFGERHFYVLPTQADGEPAMGAGAKQFFVSPFMDMSLTYDFRVHLAGERLEVVVGSHDEIGRPVLGAAFVGDRRPLDDANLARAFLTHPLLTLKVVGAIHFEAARLFLKGFRLRRRPPPPVDPMTLVAEKGAEGGIAASLCL